MNDRDVGRDDDAYRPTVHRSDENVLADDDDDGETGDYDDDHCVDDDDDVLHRLHLNAARPRSSDDLIKRSNQIIISNIVIIILINYPSYESRALRCCRH